MLVVLNMKQQNVDMTCILYNGIYSKKCVSFSWTKKKSISGGSTKTYCLHSALTDDRRDAHYILIYLVQGQ